MLVLIAGLLGLSLGAAWLLPGMLDWDRYRTTIESLASAALGRPVHIAGRITLELIPEPLLTAAAVKVDAEDGLALSARELRLGIAPAALLRGTIDARDLVLRDPVINVPWPMQAGTLAFHRPPWLAALSAHIVGGVLNIGALTFTGIDATLAAGGPDGGYRLSGTARRDGDWRFTARLQGMGRDGTAGLDLSLDGLGTRQGLGARFNGQLDSTGMLGGQLDAQGPDLSRLLPAPAVPFRAAGRLTLASGLVAADELALDIGGSPARGAVALRLLPQPRLDLALAASRIDLDAWMPALLEAPQAAYPVGVDLSAEAAELAGGMLRRLRVTFDVAGASDDPTAIPEVAVREASAILPGDANLRLRGTVQRAVPGKTEFTGTATLEAPEFRTTLHWLDSVRLQPFAALPLGVMRNLSLTGMVSADAERLSVTGLHGKVDGAGIDGTMAVGFGPRLALAANLATDRIALDAWLPARWPALAALPGILPQFDLDLRFAASHAQYRGYDIAPLAADLAWQEGRLELRRLDLSGQGVQAHLAGSISDAGRVSDAQMSLATREVADAVPLLPPAWRVPPLWHGPASLALSASGPPDALALKLAAEVNDLRIEAQPVLDLPHEAWAGPLTLQHPGAPRLLQTLGLTGAASWIGDGSFSLVAGLAATPHRLRAEKLELVAGSLRAGGDLTLDQPSDAPASLTGHLVAETLPLPDIDLRATDPLPLSWVHDGHGSYRRGTLQIEAGHVLLGLAPALDQARATVSLDAGVLRLDGLKATLAGGTLTGSAAMEAAAEPPVLHGQTALTGATIGARLTDLPLDLSSGQVDAALSATATGHSPAALLATLDGQLRLAVRDGALTGFNLSQIDEALQHNAPDPILAAGLTGGSTGFDRLELQAALHEGRLDVGDCQMQSATGGATFSGSIDLAGAALDLRAALHPDLADAPTLGLRLTGPWENVRRIPQLASVTIWRAGLPTSK